MPEKIKKTAKDLAQMIVSLIPEAYIRVVPDDKLGWRAVVKDTILPLPGAQQSADRIAAELRERYELIL